MTQSISTRFRLSDNHTDKQVMFHTRSGETAQMRKLAMLMMLRRPKF